MRGKGRAPGGPLRRSRFGVGGGVNDTAARATQADAADLATVAQLWELVEGGRSFRGVLEWTAEELAAGQIPARDPREVACIHALGRASVGALDGGRSRALDPLVRHGARPYLSSLRPLAQRGGSGSCPHLPPIPHRVASARRTVDSGPTLVLAMRSRRRERALTEAEAYARCHGKRALYAVRVPASQDRDPAPRTPHMRPLVEQ